jgi:thiol-disulfide isomerase/thioredoxin
MNIGRAPRRAPLPAVRRTRRALCAAALPVAVVTAALTLSACSSGGKSGGGGDTNFVASDPDSGVQTVAASHRRPTGTLAGPTLQGTKLDVASFKGKVVVINVWGSWCSPCRAEASTLVKAANADKAKGVAFVGIDTRDTNKDQGVAFEKGYHVPYPSLYDPTGKLLVQGFPKGTLNPQGIPTTIVLDKQGRIAARNLGAVNESKLDEMINPLIAEK